MTRMLLTLPALVVLIGTVWAADAPPAATDKPESKANETAPAPTLEAVLAQKIQREIATVGRRITAFEEEVKIAAADDVREAAQALLTVEQNARQKLTNAADILTKGQTDAANALRDEVFRMRRDNQMLSRRFEVLKQNQRYRELAAKSPDNAELQLQVDKFVKASLAILDLETQLAQRGNEKREAMAEVDKIMRASPPKADKAGEQ